MKNIFLNKSGFTLIEALVAIVILAVGVLSVVSMQGTGIYGNAKANRITNASTVSTDHIESLFNMDWDDPTLADTDPPKDGIAGINNTTAATADGTRSSADGLYTIYWNVAEEYPMPNLKKIRVIIVSNRENINPIVMDYIKSKQF